MHFTGQMRSFLDRILTEKALGKDARAEKQLSKLPSSYTILASQLMVEGKQDAAYSETPH